MIIDISYFGPDLLPGHGAFQGTGTGDAFFLQVFYTWMGKKYER